MPTVSALDQYADSMFRFERIHPTWIESCAGYLRHIFGPALEGKVFLDYAFGRGNWSLAALKAGAANVVAIDVAAGNVQRFSDYCREHGIGKIEIVHGNILEQPIDRRADVLWIYGILPCIAEADPFIAMLSELRRNDNALALLYTYDAGSFRQVVVDGARRGCVYASERDFAADSYLFTPPARLRARDDLTAPIVTWTTAQGLADLAMRHGMVPYRQLPDFRDWLTGSPSQEFSPHHLLCSFRPGPPAPLIEPQRPLAFDFSVIESIASALFSQSSPALRHKIAIGLFNAHFSSLRGDNATRSAVVEDFLFLIHAALRLEMPHSAFDERGRIYYNAAMAATRDAPRGFSPDQVAVSPLAEFLKYNTVRF